MRLCVKLSRNRLYRWHLWLIERLGRAHHVEVAVVSLEDCDPIPSAVRSLFELERLIYGVPKPGAIDAVDPSEVPASPAAGSLFEDYDAVIDCSGTSVSSWNGMRILVPLFDGGVSEAQALSTLIDGGLPNIAVVETTSRQTLLTGRPAVRDRAVLSGSLDNICSSVVALLEKALNGAGPHEGESTGKLQTEPRLVSARVADHVATTLARKSLRRLAHLATGGESWAVGWRRDPVSLLDAGTARFWRLPDDGRRYYADPFVLAWNGLTYLFVEDFPYALGKGCISVCVVDGGRIKEVPRICLEEGHHLSYPFVFEHEGIVYMIPESGANRTVDLYRSDPFPYSWRHTATLIDDAALYDATVFHDGAHWTMLASSGDRYATGWDRLHVYHAEHLLGPWRAAADNPLRIDRAGARPAGRPFLRDGRWIQPMQDCSLIYGGAINLFDAPWNGAAFPRDALGRITCDGFGAHTYNRAGSLEVIDVFGELRSRRDVEARCFFTARPSA